MWTILRKFLLSLNHTTWFVETHHIFAAASRLCDCTVHSPGFKTENWWVCWCECHFFSSFSSSVLLIHSAQLKNKTKKHKKMQFEMRVKNSMYDFVSCNHIISCFTVLLLHVCVGWGWGWGLCVVTAVWTRRTITGDGLKIMVFFIKSSVPLPAAWTLLQSIFISWIWQSPCVACAISVTIFVWVMENSMPYY